MPFQLSFTRREKYGSLATGINLETTLRFGNLFINCDAKVDTGAEVWLFQRAIGFGKDKLTSSSVIQNAQFWIAD